MQIPNSRFPNNKQTTIHFEVEDTGPGVAAEEMDKLFTAFGQTETGSKLPQGTGLGLAISQTIVQLMGGNINVSSTLNRGTTFTFDIQVTLAEATEIKTSQQTRKVIGLAPNQPEYRILVVDDRPESRLFLLKLLKFMGFSVREAENGQEAIKIWSSYSPHLILMDMRMPVMNGYKATKQIKEKEREMARGGDREDKGDTETILNPQFSILNSQFSIPNF
jgi:CheY-like chemotaxis protein